MNIQRFLGATAIVGVLSALPVAAMAKTGVAASAAPVAATDGQTTGSSGGQNCADGSTPAQDGSCPPATLPANGSATPATDEKEIIVTGSRIRGSTFTSDSPIQFITKNESRLAGARNVAEVLQDAGVTSGTAQINNTFLGFVSEGGAGVNTVGLLGLGSQRTLVLLNGRRLSPAGVGPQLVAADLNVLPDAVLDHIEVIKNGASSVYGSDAVGGVVNIITDTKMNGLTLDAFSNVPLDSRGAGANYRLSVAAGKTFDRGHILASFEYREQTAVKLGDRKDMSCPTDLIFDPASGKQIGQLTPDGSQLRCFPFANGAVGTAQNYVLGISYLTTGQVNRYGFPTGDINSPINVNNTNLRALASPRQLEEDFYSPVRTYTGYVNAAYELGALGDAELYAEGLFTRRESSQANMTQISIDPNQIGFEIYGGALAGYGYPSESPFFPNSLASAAHGSNDALRVFIVPQMLRSTQKVDFYRGNVGLRGNVGIGDIRYDANFQYSRTDGTSGVQGIDTRRIRASLLPVLAPAGTPGQYVTTAIAGEAGAGGNYTCASNVTAGAYNGGKCVAADFFNPSTLAGNLPANLFNWLYTNQIERTKYEEEIAQLVFDGTLFKLPAGPVGFAVGGEWRRDAIDDIPSEPSQTGNLYNYSSSGRTKGSDEVYEVFGELKAPLLKDQPFAKRLDVSASVRYTHNRSYGSSTTYRFGGNYAPTDFLTFRGNYGTSFRAPNLYEQFVADQSGFSTATDPCENWNTVYSPTSNLYKNCQADLTAAIGAAKAQNFIATSSPEVFTSGGGKALKAEKSTSWGGGFVFQPKFAKLEFAVDYFNTTVNDEVSQLGDTIITRCFESDNFRAGNTYCSFVGARDTLQGNLTTLRNAYLNIAMQKVSGIDFNLRYQLPIGGFTNVLNITATRMLHQIYQPFAEEDAVDYNGTLGTQGTAGGPKWVGSARLAVRKDNVTLYYGANYVGPMKNDVISPPVVNGVQAVSILRTHNYITQDLSVQVEIGKLGELTFGAKNLFDRKPEMISSTDGLPRVGNYFNYSGYDFLGRSLFLEVVRKF
jgi:outer membrane receptor protein involved in Fe transport